MDEEAVKDALECLLAVAAANPDGHTICLESGALAAACSAIQVGLGPYHISNAIYVDCALQSTPEHWCTVIDNVHVNLYQYV